MKREAIRVLIIDGQGGGMGRGLVEAVKKRWPALHLRAVGTNSMATAAMLRAGADEGATGENAVIFNAKWAHVMMGPIGVLTPNGLLGEVSAAWRRQWAAARPSRSCCLPIGAAFVLRWENRSRFRCIWMRR